MSVTAAEIRASEKYQKAKTHRVNVHLRRIDDADIIESLQDAKEHGISYREWLRALYERYYGTDRD